MVLLGPFKTLLGPLNKRVFIRFCQRKNRRLEFPSLTSKPKKVFVFLPQKFCGNSAKLSRKNLMGLPTFYFNYLRKINTEKINFT